MIYNSYTIPEFEYDPDKDDSNFRKHGVYLFDARELWRGRHVLVPARGVAGESRGAIVGPFRGKLFVAVYVLRGAKVRLITFHRADARFARAYAEKTQH